MSPFRKSGETRLSDGVVVSRHVHRKGLVALLCPDPSSPLAAVQIWYRVGSANEVAGRTGIAHLFEHLMFAGTKDLGPGEFDRMVEEIGGECNAATWVDWTHYSITVPSGDLDLALRLESDRMVNLVLDDEVLEAEREVVLNERLERVDDDIAGFMDEELSAMAFAIHPYGRPTIGFEDDIRGLDLATIRDFYRAHYAPDNAVVVIAGGVEERAALAAIDGFFGDLPPGKPPRRALVREPAQTAERRSTFQRETRTARLLCGYKVPGQSHPDWPALAALAGLLSGGPSSRLCRELVAEAELATYADCEVLPFSDPTLFRVAVGGTLGTSAEKLGSALDAILSAVAREPVSAIEMEKVQSALETDFWIELETADGKAEALGHYETAHGDYQTLFTIADRLRQVTADDLARVARTYLSPSTRTLVAVTGPDL